MRISPDGTVLLEVENDEILSNGSFIIPPGITSIGEWAFARCRRLQTITLAPGITSIGIGAFWCCHNLQTITLPPGITSIGNDAFRGCTRLQTITLPPGITSIGNGAFAGCRSLQSITLPPGITSIGFGAFKDCSSLQTITLPPGITSIGFGAFENCDSLQTIILPQEITSIDAGAFGNCKNLKSITLPPGITSIGVQAFKDCISLQSITLPQGITSIDSGAFGNCKNLKSIILPPGITSISSEAFWGCDNLQTITLPPGITSIGNWAFADCRSLQSITLPPGITSIGFATFWGCDNLQTITLPPGITSIETNTFENCPSLYSIIIEGSDEDRERIKALLPAELQGKVTSAHLAAQAYKALQEQLTRIENTTPLNPLYRHLNIDRHAPSMRINRQQQGAAKEYPSLPNQLFQHMNGFIADSLPAYQQAKSLMQQQPLPKTQAALETYRRTLEHIVNIALAMHAQQYQSDFAKHLYFLKKKGEFFTRTQQRPQAAAVEKLHQQLMHSYINTLPHNGRQFQEECRQAIQAARKELEQQRGWGLILNYLLLLATGVGALVVLADVGYHYATGKHCSFFQTTTDKQLDTLEDTLLDQNEFPRQNEQCGIN